MNEKLLSVENFSVIFHEKVVDNVSINVNFGDRIGIVGESGSGKSTIGLSVLRLLKGAITSGDIFFKGRSLLSFSKKELCDIRGKEIALVFQEPQFNPIRRIIFQMTDVIKKHFKINFKDAKKIAHESLDTFFMSDVTKILNSFPHELSGGEKKRVQIAMALSLKPSLLILDEPTNSLDIITSTQLLGMLNKILVEEKMSIIIITHDFSVLQKIATKTFVMYLGKIVEEGFTNEILDKPFHPYTMTLIDSIPKLGEPKLKTLPKLTVQLTKSSGCVFSSRCAFKSDLCFNKCPEMRERNKRLVRCFFDV